MKQDPRILPYLDMPIQHINDRLLKSMRRMTSKKDIIHIIEHLRKEVPDVVIRTSLIVGFPGETEEDFEELVQFIQDHPLDNVGIFKFSREEGSAAYDYPDQLDEKIKERRYKKLVATQASVLKKWSKKWMGKKLPVMIEGYHPESQYLARGRFYGQCPEIDGIVILNDFAKVDAFGKIYQVEITDVAGYDLIGKVI
jgi:ribosomal protein S12 methylthiotransferase